MCWIRGGKRTGFSDNLALFLRLSYTLEAGQKQFSSVNNRQVNTEVLPESLLDLLTFVEPHHSCGKRVSILSLIRDSDGSLFTVIDQYSVEAVTWIQVSFSNMKQP